ncbi:hypothetical protein AB0K89_09040 [Streptomyces cinnamoneus]|uniref:hypothetical protein n=1 Tax=Streptomyces cinnamoneus TaxID=53446 RepID=UPI003432857D
MHVRAQGEQFLELVDDEHESHRLRAPAPAGQPGDGAAGVSYPELVDRLIQAALRRPTGLR